MHEGSGAGGSQSRCRQHMSRNSSQDAPRRGAPPPLPASRARSASKCAAQCPAMLRNASRRGGRPQAHARGPRGGAVLARRRAPPSARPFAEWRRRGLPHVRMRMPGRARSPSTRARAPNTTAPRGAEGGSGGASERAGEGHGPARPRRAAAKGLPARAPPKPSRTPRPPSPRAALPRFPARARACAHLLGPRLLVVLGGLVHHARGRRHARGRERRERHRERRWGGGGGTQAARGLARAVWRAAEPHIRPECVLTSRRRNACDLTFVAPTEVPHFTSVNSMLHSYEITTKNAEQLLIRMGFRAVFPPRFGLRLCRACMCRTIVMVRMWVDRRQAGEKACGGAISQRRRKRAV